jgi:hypothetical protein
VRRWKHGQQPARIQRPESRIQNPREASPLFPKRVIFLLLLFELASTCTAVLCRRALKIVDPIAKIDQMLAHRHAAHTTPFDLWCSVSISPGPGDRRPDTSTGRRWLELHGPRASATLYGAGLVWCYGVQGRLAAAHPGLPFLLEFPGSGVAAS